MPTTIMPADSVALLTFKDFNSKNFQWDDFLSPQQLFDAANEIEHGYAGGNLTDLLLDKGDYATPCYKRLIAHIQGIKKLHSHSRIDWLDKFLWCLNSKPGKKAATIRIAFEKALRQEKKSLPKPPIKILDQPTAPRSLRIIATEVDSDPGYGSGDEDLADDDFFDPLHLCEFSDPGQLKPGEKWYQAGDTFSTYKTDLDQGVTSLLSTKKEVAVRSSIATFFAALVTGIKQFFVNLFLKAHNDALEEKVNAHATQTSTSIPDEYVESPAHLITPHPTLEANSSRDGNSTYDDSNAATSHTPKQSQDLTKNDREILRSLNDKLFARKPLTEGDFNTLAKHNLAHAFLLGDGIIPPMILLHLNALILEHVRTSKQLATPKFGGKIRLLENKLSLLFGHTNLVTLLKELKEKYYPEEGEILHVKDRITSLSGKRFVRPHQDAYVYIPAIVNIINQTQQHTPLFSITHTETLAGDEWDDQLNVASMWGKDPTHQQNENRTAVRSNLLKPA